MPFSMMAGLAPIAKKYDAFILDLWGVVHNGIEPYPGVHDCMAKLREDGRKLLLLSNAPRTNDFVQEFLENMGVERSEYDDILTSGDMARIVLRDEKLDFLTGGNKTFYQIGADRDRGLDDGLSYTRVYDVHEAEFVICTGLSYDVTETPEDYRPLLEQAVSRKLPMLCANPDLTVMRGETMHYCAGSLAQLFETLGGSVELFGKPYPWAYKMAMEVLGVTDPSRVLAIGDSMRTDIKGAVGAGIDNVLVSGGIHAKDWGLSEGARPSMAQVDALIAEHGFSPTYVIGQMSWT